MARKRLEFIKQQQKLSKLIFKKAKKIVRIEKLSGKVGEIQTNGAKTVII